MRITLNGLVVASDNQWLYDWFGIDAFSPATVRQALADNPEGEDLEVEINSPGGSVFSGFELYSLLLEARCRTVAIVQSMAGSAASTMMAGCDHVVMTPVAQVMIHLPASYAEGNQNDMRHEAKVLESITQSILNGYEAKCRGKADRARLDKLMRAESWLTAQDALELGLADEIMAWDNAQAMTAEIVNCVGGSIKTLANSVSHGTSPEALLTRYEQLVREGAAPAEGHPVASAEPNANSTPSGIAPESIADDWTRRARLAIEHNRFLEV